MSNDDEYTRPGTDGIPRESGIDRNHRRVELVRLLNNPNAKADKRDLLLQLAQLGPGTAQLRPDPEKPDLASLPYCEAVIIHELDNCAGMEISLDDLVAAMEAFSGRSFSRKHVIETCSKLARERRILKGDKRGHYCLPMGWIEAWNASIPIKPVAMRETSVFDVWMGDEQLNAMGRDD